MHSMHYCNLINRPGHGATYFSGTDPWIARLGPMTDPPADLLTESFCRLADSVILAFRGALHCTLVGSNAWQRTRES